MWKAGAGDERSCVAWCCSFFWDPQLEGGCCYSVEEAASGVSRVCRLRMPTAAAPRALVPSCIDTEVKAAREINGKEDWQLYF